MSEAISLSETYPELQHQLTFTTMKQNCVLELNLVNLFSVTATRQFVTPHDTTTYAFSAQKHRRNHVRIYFTRPRPSAEHTVNFDLRSPVVSEQMLWVRS